MIDGSAVYVLKQPIRFSFVLVKFPGNKVFFKPETIHYKKINIFVLNTITFYSEDDYHEEVKFNGGTLTFTSQLIKT